MFIFSNDQDAVLFALQNTVSYAVDSNGAKTHTRDSVSILRIATS